MALWHTGCAVAKTYGLGAAQTKSAVVFMKRVWCGMGGGSKMKSGMELCEQKWG